MGVSSSVTRARSDTSILASFFLSAAARCWRRWSAAAVLAGRVAASMAARPGPNTRSVKNRAKAAIMRSSRTLTVRWPG
jgi:hypothetical protein